MKPSKELPSWGHNAGESQPIGDNLVKGIYFHEEWGTCLSTVYLSTLPTETHMQNNRSIASEITRKAKSHATWFVAFVFQSHTAGPCR